MFALSNRVWAVFDPFFNTFSEISNGWHTTTHTTFLVPVHNYSIVNFLLSIVSCPDNECNTLICVVNGLAPQTAPLQAGVNT